MQDGDPMGKVLPHVLLEGYVDNLRVDINTPSTTERAVQSHDKGPTLAQTNKPDQNAPKGSMTKDMGSFTSRSGSKSKNKPSKKKRDALKKRLVETKEGSIASLVSPGEVGTNQEAEICKKFILVDDLNPMVFTPLNVQVQTSPSRNLPDVTTNICTLNSDLILPSSSEKEFDEYVVINSEDKVDQDQMPIEDEDEDEALSEHLIRDFNPSYNVELQEKCLQFTQEQGLSPRGIYQGNDHSDKGIKGVSKYCNPIFTLIVQ